MRRFSNQSIQTDNLLDPSPDHWTGDEQQIISSIKTFRKEN